MKAFFLGVLKLAAAMLVGLVAFIVIALGGLHALSDAPEDEAGVLHAHEQPAWQPGARAPRKDGSTINGDHRPHARTLKREGECADRV